MTGSTRASAGVQSPAMSANIRPLHGGGFGREVRRESVLTTVGRRWRLRGPLWRDARIWQIAFLATLLSIGVFLRDFSLDPRQMLLAFVAGLATQWLWLKSLKLESRGPLSAIITCFGLSILLRADSLSVHPLAAALAISSKFTLRIAGKHIYNPANLGAIVALGFAPGTWVSSGQWGQDVALAAWFVALGGFVTQRARRWDIAWVFLAGYLGLVALRILWLGQSTAVFVHQLESGALLLFAFFMISDPMTIPNRQAARVGYALLVAAMAFLWQYALFRPNGLLWALFFASPLVPVIDRWFKAAKFEWRG